MPASQEISVTGLKIGHYTDSEGATGCTVPLCPHGGVRAVDVRGSAPGTRETDIVSMTSIVERVHAILLAGGSAFDLAAADGLMDYLAERGGGYPSRAGPIPMVPATVIYALGIGDASARADRVAGYSACIKSVESPPSEGSVVVGTGATVAKSLGEKHLIKSGVGYASEVLADGHTLAALIVVNALGDVYGFHNGEVIAGPRDVCGRSSADGLMNLAARFANNDSAFTNTTIGVVATDGRLFRWQAQKIAQCAQDGIALSIRPAHTIFALSTNTSDDGSIDSGRLSDLGWRAANLVSTAIERGVRLASGSRGVPALTDLEPQN